jgi:ribonuclease VapC
VIVVDSSAIIAIAIKEEPGWLNLLAALQGDQIVFLSPINYVEIGIILATRGVFADAAELDRWLASYGVEVRNDPEVSKAALQAYLTFGKGVHPARLNLADCFAYALAKTLDAPLLYKGNDFALTDVRSALQPT